MFDAQITFLPVRDLERSSRFYESLLGLKLVLDQGRCRIFRCAAQAYVGICDTRPPQPGGAIVTLVTDDVDGVGDRLAAAGVTIETPPRSNAEFGIYQLFARDPDGHLIEIQRFDNPGWAAGPD